MQTRNWNWVIGANARALFFSFVSFAASNLLLSPSHPLSLAQSSCFCYALVTVRKLQLLLWLRVGGNDEQMTNFILCHLMMTTSTHKIQQEQGGRERETKPVLVAANFWRWRHSCRAAAPAALLLLFLLVLLRFMFYAGNKKPRKKAAPKRFTSAAPTALIPFFLFPFPPPLLFLMCLSGLFFGLLRAKRVLHVISFSSLFTYLPLCLSPFFVLTTMKSVLGQKVNVPQARTDQPEKRKKTETQTKSLATHLSITIHTQSTCVGNGNLGSIFPCNWWVNNTKYEYE